MTDNMRLAQALYEAECYGIGATSDTNQKVILEAAKAFANAAPKIAHKVMTPEEYTQMPIIGWHEVCRDIDGFGGVGVRYLGISSVRYSQVIPAQPQTVPTPAFDALAAEVIDRIRERYNKLAASPLGMATAWERKASGGKPLLYGGKRGLLAHGTIATWDEFDLIADVINNLPTLLAACSVTRPQSKCPRCKINPADPALLGSDEEGHICGTCWAEDRHANPRPELGGDK